MTNQRGRIADMDDKQTEAACAKARKEENTASQLIDAKIMELDDWRGETLARVRNLIREADLDVVEDVKWRKPSRLTPPVSRSGHTRGSSAPARPTRTKSS